MTEYTTEIHEAYLLEQESFVTSTTLYPISREDLDLRSWGDTGVRLNATYLLTATYLVDSQSDQIGFYKLRFRSHICDLTAGTMTYNIELKNGTVKLGDKSNSDDFDKM